MDKDLDRNRLSSYLDKIPRAFLSPLFLGRSKVFLKPNLISLEMEDRCCFSCLQCDIWKKKKNQNRLTFSRIKEIILALKNWLGFYQLNLAGGEPFMNANTLPTIRFASKNGVFVAVNTNGFLIDEKMARELVKGRISSLSFSLDSLTASVHDKIRGRSGAHRKVMEAIDHILKYRAEEKDPFVSLTTIILRQNLSQLPELVKFAKKKGLDTGFFQPLWHNFGADCYDRLWYKKSRLWPESSREVDRAIDLLIDMKKKKYPVGNALFELEEYKHYFKDPISFGQSRHCYVGINSFNIGIDGKVRLCFDLEPIGDILRESPVEIWNSQRAQKSRKEIARCQRGCKVLLCNMPVHKRKASNLLFKLSLENFKRSLGEL